MSSASESDDEKGEDGEEGESKEKKKVTSAEKKKVCNDDCVHYCIFLVDHTSSAIIMPVKIVGKGRCRCPGHDHGLKRILISHDISVVSLLSPRPH